MSATVDWPIRGEAVQRQPHEDDLTIFVLNLAGRPICLLGEEQRQASSYGHHGQIPRHTTHTGSVETTEGLARRTSTGHSWKWHRSTLATRREAATRGGGCCHRNETRVQTEAT